MVDILLFSLVPSVKLLVGPESIDNAASDFSISHMLIFLSRPPLATQPGLEAYVRHFA